MRLLCKLDRHRPSLCEVWNNGYFFSFCERCGRDLVRSRRRWRSVRAPNKVVWKQRQPFDMPWQSDVVPLPPAAAVPVAPEWRVLVDRSRVTASLAPPRRPRRAEDPFAAGERQSGLSSSRVTAASESSPIAAPAARSVG